MARMALAFAVLGLFTVCGAHAATDQEIAEWVKQLGSDTFEDREKAEAKLLEAGPAAIPAINKAIEAAADDLEVKLRGQKIVERLGFANRPGISNILTLYPPSCVFLLHTPNLQTLASALRKQTEAGKIFDNAEAAPLFDGLGGILSKSMHMTDDGKKAFTTWVDRFGGPFAAGMTSLDSKKQWPEREQFLIAIGVTDPKPESANEDFLKWNPVGGGQGSAIENYRGFEYTQGTGDWSRDAGAYFKGLIIRANTKTSMISVIDRIMANAAPNITGSAEYKAALARGGKDALAHFYFSMAAVIEGSRDRDGNEMRWLGFDSFKDAIVTAGVENGGTVERAFCRVEGKRRGIPKLFSFAVSTGKQAAVCPPDALGFVSVPLDGKDVYDTILDISEQVSPNGAAEFRREIGTIEEKAGIKVGAILEGVNGETAAWVMEPKGFTPPVLGGVIGTKDAAAAAALADGFAKFMGATPNLPPDLIQNAEYKGRKIYWADVQKHDKGHPYQFCWCADGARVQVASSTEVLKQRLNQSDAKAPGLDSTEDYKRALAAIPAEERGGIAYINNSRVLTFLVMAGVPALSAASPGTVPDTMAAAAKDPTAIFAKLPGTMLAVSTHTDGVQARGLGGLPVSGILFALPLTFFSLIRM